MDDVERRERDAARKRLSRRLAREQTPAVVTADEEPDEWAEFRRQVWQDLSPRGMVDASICDLVAAALWRMQRVVRLEAGCLTRFLISEQGRRMERVAACAAQGLDNTNELYPRPSEPRVLPYDADMVSTFSNLQDYLARYTLIEGRLANELRRLLAALREARSQSGSDAESEALDVAPGGSPPADPPQD